MGNALTVSEHERGVVRVFSVPQDLGLGDDMKRLARALGVPSLKARDVQLLKVADMDDLGLAGLLTEGYDVAPDDIDMASIGAVAGYVAVIRSGAFHAPAILTLADGVTLIGDYRERSAPAPRFTPLQSDAATGPLGGPAADADPATGRGNRVLLIVLAAMVTALLWTFFYYVGF